MEPSQLFRDASTARNELFSKLKPCCVEMSKLAMTSTSSVQQRARRLVELLEQLLAILDAQIGYNVSVLDAKFAEYVFFPLSFIFKSQEQWPGRLIELAVHCLRLLIQYGWRDGIGESLTHQLLILLTFIVGGVPGQGSRRELPEEATLEGYRALTALIKASRASPSLTAAKIIPALGHTIAVILEGTTEGATVAIQLEALEAVSSLYATVKDQEALASFFPGTVSSLTKALSPPIVQRSQAKFIVKGLLALKTVITSVLGDVKIRNILKQSEHVKPEEAEEGRLLSPAWLRATSAQLKIALSTTLKLRNTGSDEVRKALEKLCISLLDECHSSLSESKSILVETAMVLWDGEKEEPLLQPRSFDQDLVFGTTLQDLARIYPEIGDEIKITMYNWVTSLPRVMQSSDEGVKQQAIRNLLEGNELATALQMDSSTLEDALASALRDSMVTLIVNSKPAKILDEVDSDINSLTRTGQSDMQLQPYQPVLLAQESQKQTRSVIVDLISKIGPPSQQTKLAAEMLSFVRDSDGVDQISSYWLAFELLKASYAPNSDLENFLDLSSTMVGEDQELVFQELYSFSVSVLSSHSDLTDVDWRLEAISLEVASYAASRMKEAFRPELIDVLYPIAAFLGSQSPHLRGHAITTLNSIADSCGYASVSVLIIDNVDYMVNSVSLRLNTFDISPASTKVLTMMIRLTGPSLVPYLDDVVAAIFAALDNYHGYPVFVESLFAVLSEVVEQGVKSDALLIGDGALNSINHRKKSPEGTSIEEIAGYLETRAAKRKRDGEEADIEEIRRTGHLHKPWEMDEAKSEDENREREPSSSEVEKTAPPKTPTYSLLTRVTTLTQHYLTSPSPTLRKSLLDLLGTVCPALAPDEEAFLPIVNAIWPVFIARLHDSEPFVVISACKALGMLCESAGDFLSSRIKTEWWDGLGKWCLKAKREASNATGSAIRAKASRASGGRGQNREQGMLIPIRSAGGDISAQLVEQSKTTALGRHTQAVRIWGGVAGLLTDIVSFVRVDDAIFDQILDLLGDRLAQDAAARSALEAINADAVWLALYKKGQFEMAPALHSEQFHFAQMGEVH